MLVNTVGAQEAAELVTCTRRSEDKDPSVLVKSIRSLHPPNGLLLRASLIVSIQIRLIFCSFSGALGLGL